ncbi:hypothetical protein [Paenibacillus segetis]|uniref:DUF4025 domain-containing protein n=1 Tax=Paenibacillus segetis TaxID=1325360 RepID=A0ABQ1YU76_9BACL|nr:hypothetical protein [Paenibacillus segetis]GGH38959.1 hypothetical protein GCM10008013_47380 [Paenibacillus segetis]
MSSNNPEDEQEQYVNKQIREAKEGELPKHKDISVAENGSMINDIDDLIQLSEDMEEMTTETQDKDHGLVSDPEQ